MEEIWKDIKGFEGLYQVSNLGRVKSFYHGEKIIKQCKHNGYYIIKLYKDKIQYGFSVHRLVAEAFVPNPNNLPQVGHKDEKNLSNSNECNNCADNLEWTTSLKNNNMPLHIDRLSGKNNYMYGKHCSDEVKAKISAANSGKNNFFYGKHHTMETLRKTSKPVYCIETDTVFYSCGEASRQMKCNQGHITDCCKGNLKTTGGYHWRYATVEEAKRIRDTH